MASSDRISIIIPVYEETGRISRALGALSHAAGIEDAEIIVVDGHGHRTTLRVLPHGSVRGICAPRGRGAQMHAGALAATGSTLLFLHVDTRLPAGALLQIRTALQDPMIDGGAFDLGIDAAGAAFRLIERGASLRSRMTRIPYGDQAVFLKREAYFRLGGFRPLPLMEDVDLMRRLKRSGGRIRFFRQRVRTSARRWRREGILFCTLRNYALIGLYYLGVSPERLARHYPVNGRRKTDSRHSH